MTTEIDERPETVYTTRGVAALLGISPEHLRAAELRRHIPAARRDEVGARFYFDSDLPAIAAYFSGRPTS